MTGILHEDKNTFMIIGYLAEFSLELQMFQKKIFTENQNTHFVNLIFIGPCIIAIVDE